MGSFHQGHTPCSADHYMLFNYSLPPGQWRMRLAKIPAQICSRKINVQCFWHDAWYGREIVAGLGGSGEFGRRGLGLIPAVYLCGDGIRVWHKSGADHEDQVEFKVWC